MNLLFGLLGLVLELPGGSKIGLKTKKIGFGSSAFSSLVFEEDFNHFWLDFGGSETLKTLIFPRKNQGFRGFGFFASGLALGRVLACFWDGFGLPERV